MTERKKAAISAAMAFLATFAIVAAAFAAYGVWPFGDNTTLIVDSIHQYLPFHSDLSRALKDGSSLQFSMNGGLGYDRWQVIAYYAASPLNALLAVVPTENVCDFMDWAIALKIALAGAAMAWYVGRRAGRIGIARGAALGVAYALSAWAVGYYFNLMWLDGFALTPLVAWALERLVREGRGVAYSLLLGLAIWSNYYVGFMICVFCVLWFAKEEAAGNGRPGRLAGDLARFAAHSAIAGGLAGAMILPAWRGLSASESVTGNSGAPSVSFYADLAELFQNHAAFLEPINISNSQVGLNAYCGTAVLPGFVLFLLDAKKRGRERIARLVVAAFLFLGFTLSVLNWFLHGAHVQNGIPNRFAFLYVFVLIACAADGLADARENHWAKTLAAHAVPAAAFAAIWFLGKADAMTRTAFLATEALTAGYLALNLLVRAMGDRAARARIAAGAFAVAMVAEAAGYAFYGFGEDGQVDRPFYIRDADAMREMVDGTEDRGFYRVEIDRQHMRDAMTYAGFKSATIFNSTMPASVTDLLSSLGVEARTNKTGYYGYTAIANDLFGIKYVGTPNGKAETFYGMLEEAESGPLKLYANPDALSVGYVVDSAVTEWEPLSGNPLENQNSLLSAMTGDGANLYWKFGDLEAKSGEATQIPVVVDAQTYLLPSDDVESLTVSTAEYEKTSRSYNAWPWPVNAVGDDANSSFTAEMSEAQESMGVFSAWYCYDEDYEKVLEELGKEQLENVSWTGTTLSGNVSSEDGGSLVVTIPFTEGWTVRVNGEDVTAETGTVGGCLFAIPVGAGDSYVELEYATPGLKSGIALTILSALALLALAAAEGKISRAERARKPDGRAYCDTDVAPGEIEIDAEATVTYDLKG